MRKNLLQATQGLLYIVLGLVLLIWLMAYATGHHIPLKTNLAFGAAAGLIVFLVLLVGRYLKRFNND